MPCYAAAVELRSTETFERFLAMLSRAEKENVLGTLRREMQRIRLIPSGPSRARWVHGIVDEALASFARKQPEITEQVRCGKGCAHCCHFWVGITRDEAELLAERVRQGRAQPAADRLALQRHWQSPLDFQGKPAGQAACVFLGEGGACTVYEDRPSACRSRLVASDPEWCRGLDDDQTILEVTNPYLEAVVSAALSVDAEGDPPPVYGRPLAATLHEAITGIRFSGPATVSD